MRNQEEKTGKPYFNSLGEIMEHFHQVPFEQFKSELDEWFLKSLDKKGINLQKLNGVDTKDFPAELQSLVKKIYDQGEDLRRKHEES